MDRRRKKQAPPSHATSWEDVADWYRGLARKKGRDLVARVVNPEVLRLAGPLEGRSVLDVGCGPGALARVMAERGAAVTGVDASPKMIEIAIRDAKEARIDPAPRFLVADAAEAEALPPGPFDLVTIVLALQNIQDPRRALGSVTRRMAPGGRLVLALNHPCFRNPGATHWGWDSETKVQFRRVDGYRTPRRVDIQVHPGSDPKLVRPSFHWPLESLFGWLRDAGLRVVDLAEPVSDRSSHGGRAAAENRARAEIPMFLVLLAERERSRGGTRPRPTRRTRA
jgi:ubiquinone/menaquinone biosynthesis C-methylase UbiE